MKNVCYGMRDLNLTNRADLLVILAVTREYTRIPPPDYADTG